MCKENLLRPLDRSVSLFHRQLVSWIQFGGGGGGATKKTEKTSPKFEICCSLRLFLGCKPPLPQFTAREKQNSSVPGTYVIEGVLARGSLLSAHLKNQQQHFLTAVLPDTTHLKSRLESFLLRNKNVRISLKIW